MITIAIMITIEVEFNSHGIDTSRVVRATCEQTPDHATIQSEIIFDSNLRDELLWPTISGRPPAARIGEELPPPPPFQI
jgi:hypothetical protein